jgi:hypothetical protein
MAISLFFFPYNVVSLGLFFPKKKKKTFLFVAMNYFCLVIRNQGFCFQISTVTKAAINHKKM